jgi:hypothetical protein
LSDFQKVAGAVPVSGRYVYRDDFDDLSQWNIMTSPDNCVVSDSILQISNGDEVRSKQKFLYGLLIVVAKSSAAGSLQFGFSDGGNDYVVWSNNYLRYKSTADPTEGTAYAAPTETSYNVYALLWEPDNVTLWINGSPSASYQGSKVPNKPLPISIKNLSSTAVVYVDFVVVYPEVAGVWLTQGPGQTSTGNLAISAFLQSSANRIGFVGVVERLLATPYTDTTTALGANASFIGTARDTQLDSGSPYCYLGFIRAAALADQPGTLYIDESPDNSTWILGVRSVAVSANTVAIIEHKPIYRYVRVRYVNGATAQTSFRLWSRVGGVQS